MIGALLGWKGYVIAGAAGVALVSGAAAGVWLYGKAQYSAGYDDAQAEQRLAELEGFREQARKLSGISGQLETGLAALREAKPRIIREYHHATTIQPLPDGCVLDAGRLQHINTAIGAARSAGEPGSAVPAAAGSADR